ncbi:helix-turn-helix domain-containing protein [Aquamicrobium sp.]|uniref:helix-turn-helix domain-containing protein n=1 Tax=Aquamicrobium sp. TaxID=1872579 RepID=UPI00349EC357
MAAQRICEAQGCTKPFYAKGYCLAHYYRNKRHGTLDATRHAPGEAIAFLETLASGPHEDQCIAWPYGRTPNGYGRVIVDGRKQVASRVVCELAHGRAPSPEYEAAHSCGKGHLGCVNPKHLRWATQEENRADMILHGTAREPKKRVRKRATGKRRVGAMVFTARFSEDDVRQIRAMHESGMGARRIGRSFGCDPTTVARVFRRETWKHVE